MQKRHPKGKYACFLTKAFRHDNMSGFSSRQPKQKTLTWLLTDVFRVLPCCLFLFSSVHDVSFFYQVPGKSIHEIGITERNVCGRRTVGAS